MQKSDFLSKTGLCYICLKGKHPVQNCKFKDDPNSVCNICSTLYSRCNHGTTTNGIVLHTEVSAATAHGCGDGGDLTVAPVADGRSCGGGVAQRQEVVVEEVQDVKVNSAPSSLPLCDAGNQVSLILYSHAKKAEKKGKPKMLVLAMAEGHAPLMDIQEYILPLLDRECIILQVKLYRMVQEVTTCVQASNKNVVRDIVPYVSNMSAHNLKGKADIKVRLPHSGLHSKEVATVGDLKPNESQCGSGHLLGDKKGHGGRQTNTVTLKATVLNLGQGHFGPMDFLKEESVGTEVPKCGALRESGKECTQKMVPLGRGEHNVPAITEEVQKLDEAKGKWTAIHPFLILLIILKDNERQADACRKRLKKHFINHGDLRAISRGVEAKVAHNGVKAKVSENQAGKSSKRRPKEEWPVKKKTTPPRREEPRQGAVAAICVVATMLEPFIKYSTTLNRLRVCGCVFLFLSKARKETTHGQQVAFKEGQVVKSGPPPGVLKMSENYLVEEAQPNVDIEKLDTLMPVHKVDSDLLGCKRSHRVVGGRKKAKMKIGHNKTSLPILDDNSPLAKLFLAEAHRVGHGGQNNVVLRSRKRAWIVKARSFAAALKEAEYKWRSRPLAIKPESDPDMLGPFDPLH